MKKQSSGSTTKDQKNLGAIKSATQNKKGKSSQSNDDSTDAATSNVKSKVGHGMANEGTNRTYEKKNN